MKDLCLFSRTCKRFQALCENHFRRKYSREATQEMQIKIENNSTLCLSQSYIRYFYSFIKNVKICALENFRHKKDLKLYRVTNFVKTRCDQNLRKIWIEGDMALVPFCEEIEKFLRNVEVVQFSYRNEKGRDEATFLKYCPNITKLILDYEIDAENVEAILEQKFQQLTHFYFMDTDVRFLNTKKLQPFFENNDSIRCVALKFNLLNYEIAKDHVLECIKAVHHVIHLKNLLLSINRKLVKHFDSIYGCLKVLCERDNFKSLEIEFSGKQGADALTSHANQLANLKQLTKLYLTHIRLTDVIPALHSFINLKTIVLRYLRFETDWLQSSYFDQLIDRVDGTRNMTLPRIEEVHIEEINNDRQLSIYVMQFVRHWINLKRILVPRSIYDDTKFDIAELNRAREKLKNACELTIYTNHRGNATNLDHELLKLKFVEFERGSDAYPFQDYTMTTKQ